MTQIVSHRWPWVMLIARSALFLSFQALIASLFFLIGYPTPWDSSAAWWPITVILTNGVCLVLLVRLYRLQGKRFWDNFRIDRRNIREDLILVLASLLLIVPLGYFPNLWCAQWLFGDLMVPLHLLVRPLPLLAAFLAFVLFPITQGLVEIPTYMLYAMPGIEAQGKPGWLALSLASLCLAGQHMFVPFLPDGRFILYRLIMFLPFAFFIGWMMRTRPRLMPYLAVIHVLMDFSISYMFL